MHRIWFERALPAEYAHLLTGMAEAIGPASATPENPLAVVSGADAEQKTEQRTGRPTFEFVQSVKILVPDTFDSRPRKTRWFSRVDRPEHRLGPTTFQATHSSQVLGFPPPLENSWVNSIQFPPL
jgi:hypothetical protein